MVCMGTRVRRRHVYQVDTYFLSKVFLMCTSLVLSVAWFLFAIVNDMNERMLGNLWLNNI